MSVGVDVGVSVVVDVGMNVLVGVVGMNVGMTSHDLHVSRIHSQ